MPPRRGGFTLHTRRARRRGAHRTREGGGRRDRLLRSAEPARRARRGPAARDARLPRGARGVRSGCRGGRRRRIPPWTRRSISITPARASRSCTSADASTRTSSRGCCRISQARHQRRRDRVVLRSARVTQIETEAGDDREPARRRARLPARHVYTMTGFRPNTELLAQLGVPIDDPESGIPQHDPATMETTIPGIYIAGVIASGFHGEQDLHRERPLSWRPDRAHCRRSCTATAPVLTASLQRPDTLRFASGYPRVRNDVSISRRDGKARVALQAARIHLPVLRDLRRHGIGVGLRPARRRAQEERQGPLVARDGPRARRHRGARRGDPDAPAGVGSERPRRRLHRSARRLPELQEALPRRRSRRSRARPGKPDAQCPACGTKGTLDRAAACSTSCSRRSWGRSRTARPSCTCARRRRRAST